MWKTVVAPNETPALLSARAGVPVCAILRANRLFSPAWLLPGREIDMPDDCASSDFPCPALAARVSGALIDRDERKGKGASDHVPVIIDVD